MKLVQFAESYTYMIHCYKHRKNTKFSLKNVFCITLCQPCSKAKFFASYLLQKCCINTGATTEFINSFNTYFVFIFAVPYKSSSERGILVDGVIKKGWSKRMFELTRSRDIGVFL